MSSPRTLSRRRTLQITAALCGSALLPGPIAAATSRVKATGWRGTALGAPASITLYGHDRARARRTIEAAVAEVRRLEEVFSLYRSDSALSRLNRAGRLPAPPPELLVLMSAAGGVSEATGGAFDVTVQPLWALYAAHFAQSPGAADGPPAADIARALGSVDHRAVSLEPNLIAFARPGMAVTLNGIAQGFITDRAAEIIRRAGFDNVMIDLGEVRALGRHPSGRPWRVGIRSPEREAGVVRRMRIEDRAVATSAPLGTPFEATGRYHHLLDPRSGRCTGRYRTLTVTAPSATLADGLSTAFAIMPWREVRSTAARYAQIEVIARLPSGLWRTAAT